jgi:16S rRNA (guanine966-N2)-methyltransferase
MKLRIVSGELGRRIVMLPDSIACFRPTTERARQAIAESIKERIPGATVADVCAGSGIVGLEFISRGAQSADFVESNRQNANALTANCRLLNVSDRCTVIARDVRVFLRHFPRMYDIIFYDPPYDDPALAALVAHLVPALAPNGILIHERRSSAAPAGPIAGFVMAQTREYGDTAMDIWKRG